MPLLARGTPFGADAVGCPAAAQPHSMIQHREIRFSAHFRVGTGTYLRRRLRAGRMRSFNGTGPAGSRAEPPAAVEMMMHLNVDVAGTSELNFEAWRALLRSPCGGKPQAITPT